MRLKQRLTVGITVLTAGALPYLYTVWRYSQHNWTPLTYPVHLMPGIIESPYFKTDLTGTYIAGMVFDNMPDYQREDCLLGEDITKGSCRAIQQALHFSWKIVGDSQQTLKSGQYVWVGGSGTSQGQEADFVWFEGKKGRRQKIILNVDQDAGDLNTLHPRLRVEAHWSYWEDWIILGQLEFLIMMAVSIPTLVWTIWPLIFRRRISLTRSGTSERK